MNGTIPMAADAAIKSLAEYVNGDLLGLYKDVYGVYGTAGTTPFSQADFQDLTDLTGVRAVLNKQLAPKSDRRLVLDVDAEAKALTKRAMQDASWRGGATALSEGQIGRTMGFDIFSDEQVKTHTSTPLTAGAATVNGVHAIGAGSTDGNLTGTVSIAKATNASPLVYGDILTFAGDTQTYVVLADVNLIVGNTTVSIAPALQTAKAGGEAVTLKASHVVNLAFNKYAIAFASRPFSGADPLALGKYMSVADPVSGLALRLEVSREHKRTRFAYDILYGRKLVRRQLIARLLG
jgi:hypothetical protein